MVWARGTVKAPAARKRPNAKSTEVGCLAALARVGVAVSSRCTKYFHGDGDSVWAGGTRFSVGRLENISVPTNLESQYQRCGALTQEDQVALIQSQRKDARDVIPL
jgi:hypothetical protein